MKLSPITAFILCLVIGITEVFVIDPLDPTTLSTPFCLGLILMGLSFRQSPRIVVPITVIYSVLTMVAMREFTIHLPTPPQHPLFWLFQRFGLFLIVNAMAIYLSYYRDYTERHIGHIQGILAKLPTPVVISNASGSITYVNDALSIFFNQPTSELIGKRYIDLFMTDIQEAKATSYYLELFGQQSSAVQEVELKTSVQPLPTHASLTSLGVDIHRSMITVLQLT